MKTPEFLVVGPQVVMMLVWLTTAIAQPTITTQPQSRTNIVGTDATFTVGATGSEPLAYQWQFNSTDLAAKTYDLLIVTNVQTSKAGSYSVRARTVKGSSRSGWSPTTTVPVS